ncbi:MAG: PTS sugar transporter subunit IIA [Leptotrichiaceae bacterium]|nr:PTS sugar transporter subunit IIA [Leptotrichiaceae bacterium]
MDIRELISEKLICLDFKGNNKEEILNVMGKLISENGRLHNEKYGEKEALKGFSDSVREREKIFATAVGFSFAIPHGKCEYVKHSSIAYLRLTNEIKWSEDEKVRHIFMIGVSDENEGEEHLKILIKLSTAILDDKFRERLDKSETKTQVMELMKEYSERERAV